jgi:hypothetical protein
VPILCQGVLWLELVWNIQCLVGIICVVVDMCGVLHESATSQ